MKAVLLDTHTWAWSLCDDHRLTDVAASTMTNATTVFVSPISLFEIGQKVRLGKWPEMEPHVDRLVSLLEAQGGSVAALEPTICLNAATMSWTHRDPFDRLLAATAAHYRLPIVSADSVFDGVVPRIWQ